VALDQRTIQKVALNKRIGKQVNIVNELDAYEASNVDIMDLCHFHYRKKDEDEEGQSSVKKEIALKELNDLQEENTDLEAELEDLEMRVKRLQDLRKAQDILLKEVFDGYCGSPEENELELKVKEVRTFRNL